MSLKILLPLRSQSTQKVGRFALRVMRVDAHCASFLQKPIHPQGDIPAKTSFPLGNIPAYPRLSVSSVANEFEFSTS